MRSDHKVIDERTIGKCVCGSAIAAIVCATLWPFVFQFHRLTWTAYQASFATSPSALLDFPLNVVLFIPLGYGLSLAGIGGRSSVSVLLCVAIGGCLAVGVESCQIFVPGRTPNVADVVANSLGAVLGWFLCRVWRAGRTRWAVFRKSMDHFGIAWSTLLAIALLTAWGLVRELRPSQWDRMYRLAIGNELSGLEPWSGSLSDLVILDSSR